MVREGDQNITARFRIRLVDSRKRPVLGLWASDGRPLLVDRTITTRDAEVPTDLTPQLQIALAHGCQATYYRLDVAVGQLRTSYLIQLPDSETDLTWGQVIQGDLAQYPTLPKTFLLSLPAGEPIGMGRAGAVGADGKLYVGDVRNLTWIGKIAGVFLADAATGSLANLQLFGPLVNTDWNFEIGPVFAGAQGALVQPDSGLAFSQQIGRAITSNLLFINPEPSIQL